MKIQSLTGAWEFRQAGTEAWLPASVPGGAWDTLYGAVADDVDGDRSLIVKLFRKRPFSDVIAVGSVDDNELLRLVASAEQSSEHPLARAIVDGARDRGLEVLGEPAVAVEPRQRALDHPAARQQHKTPLGLGVFDYFQIHAL